MRAGVNFLSPISRCRNWVSDQRRASTFGRASPQVPRLSTPPLPRRSEAVSPTATGAIVAAALQFCHRAVHWADGAVRQCLAILRRKSGHRGLRGVFLWRDCAGSQPGAGTSPGPPIGLAGIRPARRVTDRPNHRRSAGRCHRQLSCPVFLVCRHDLRRPGTGLRGGKREFHPDGINRQKMIVFPEYLLVDGIGASKCFVHGLTDGAPSNQSLRSSCRS